MATARDTARELIEHLPDEASWNDIHYTLYVRQKIEAGRQAVAEGRTIPTEQIKARLLERKRRAS